MGAIATSSSAYAADPSGTAPPSAVVDSFAKSQGISEDVAARRLEIQNRGHDLTSRLQDVLGDRFASLSFDPDTATYHVYVVSEDDRPAVETLLADRDLAGHSDVEVVRHTWSELEAARDAAASDLAPQIRAQQAQVGIDPTANAVALKVANDVDAPVVQRARTLSDDVGVPIVIKKAAPETMKAEPTSCTYPDCSQPMRGGVMLSDGPYYVCTTGFYAYSGSSRYILTAGHCLWGNPSASWTAWDPTVLTRYWFGAYHNYYFGSQGDVGVIQATGTHWDPSGWTPRIAAWGTNLDLPVNWRDISVSGWYVCRYGVAGGSGPSASCGYVSTRGNTVYYAAEGVTVGNMTEASACAKPGDSGGPIMAGGYGAVGIQSGGAVWCGSGSGSYIIYSEAADAEVGLGVTVAHN